MFESMIETLKANPRKIVFTEGPDARILEAASRLKKRRFQSPLQTQFAMSCRHSPSLGIRFRQ